MRRPEEELLEIIRNSGVDFTASLPCEKIKTLLEMIEEHYGRPPLTHIPLTREEEGVGICAGAALAGRMPAIFVQSSGIGNMINALLSLTGFYELPLAVFVSRRGVYREKIEAQVPMGQRLPGMLRGAGIPCSVITTRKDFPQIERMLSPRARKNRIHAFLLSPEIWDVECGEDTFPLTSRNGHCTVGATRFTPASHFRSHDLQPPVRPRFTRFEIIKSIAPFLDSQVVVCNLGFPSKELYHVRHRPSNFYMLGSMGMVTPIGLGLSVSARSDVIVIDGDGSLLMNPGTLATAAHISPGNLTILAIDNGSYGSTGNQPTLTGSCVDLEAVARGFGIRETYKVSSKRQILDALKAPQRGVKFIHILAVPGNENLPNIPLHHIEIKKQVMDFLCKK